MGRRRASATGPGLLLLAPLGLLALILGRSPETPQPPSSPPVAYAALPATPSSSFAPREPIAPTPLSRQPESPREDLAPATPAAPAQAYVAGHKVPLRAAPEATGAILDRLGPGQAVLVLERRADWVRVRHARTQREGWLSAKRLRDDPPPAAAEKPATSSADVVLGTAAIAKLLIAASIADYPSRCACPYQTDRGGRSCGRRSAYSMPGGFAPLCYAHDITPAMVASYRANR